MKSENPEKEIEELLKILPSDELKKFIYEHSSSHLSFRNLFLAYFASYQRKESKLSYNAKLKLLIKNYTGKNGFIDWDMAFDVGMTVSQLVARAKEHYLEGNYRSAFYISTAVIEELTKALQFTDDSGDNLGMHIENALEVLGLLSSHKVPEEIRVMFFDYTIEVYDKKIFKGWDWHLTMLDYASNLCRNDYEAGMIMDRINKIKSQDSFEFPMAQSIKMKMTKRT